MINDWLTAAEEDPPRLFYRLININEKATVTDELKTFLGQKIIDSYRNLDYLKALYADATEEELRAYITDYVLPSNKNGLSRNVSQGDFGEFIAELIATNFYDLVVPLKKLRWKLNREKSLFCTDLFAHNMGDRIENIYFFEVKSRLTIRRESVQGISNFITVNAHNSLLKDEGSPNQGIADFLSRYYYEKEDYDKAHKYASIVRYPGNYQRNFDLFFIIEESKYSPNILDALSNLPPTLDPLRVTILLVSDLGKLIIDVRNHCIDAAVKFVLEN